MSPLLYTTCIERPPVYSDHLSTVTTRIVSPLLYTACIERPPVYSDHLSTVTTRIVSPLLYTACIERPPVHSDHCRLPVYRVHTITWSLDMLSYGQVVLYVPHKWPLWTPCLSYSRSPPPWTVTAIINAYANLMLRTNHHLSSAGWTICEDFQEICRDVVGVALGVLCTKRYNLFPILTFAMSNEATV